MSERTMLKTNVNTLAYFRRQQQDQREKGFIVLVPGHPWLILRRSCSTQGRARSRIQHCQ